ncbi:MAG: synthase subunit [Actinomycetota bacterium]|jgi:F-type H+-transporting ATPase subunit b
MTTTVVTESGGAITDVVLVAADGVLLVGRAPGAEAEAGEELDMGPNPISPETKELYWGAGAFLVLAVVMRYLLFPRLKRSMDQRYASIRADVEGADAVRAAAHADVAAYERALADARAEAAARVDAARAALDAERNAELTKVNARIAERRSVADAASAATREAVRSEISAAVASVVTRATEIAVGRAPSADAVQRAVARAMQGAGSR